MAGSPGPGLFLQVWCAGTQCLPDTRLLIAVSIRMAEQISEETSAELVIVTYNL